MIKKILTAIAATALAAASVAQVRPGIEVLANRNLKRSKASV